MPETPDQADDVLRLWQKIAANITGQPLSTFTPYDTWQTIASAAASVTGSSVSNLFGRDLLSLVRIIVSNRTGRSISSLAGMDYLQLLQTWIGTTDVLTQDELQILASLVTATGPPSTDPDAAAWASRVTANGGSVSPTTLGYVSTYVAAQKAAGLWTKKQFVMLICGSDLAAARTPLVVGSGSSFVSIFNIVSGDYAETGLAGGIKGDGTSKYFDTGWNPITAAASLSSLSASNYIQGIEAGGANRQTLGSNAGGRGIGLGWLMAGTKEGAYIAPISSAEFTPTSSPTSLQGYLSVSTNGSRSQQYYSQGLPLGTPVTSSGVFENLSLYALAANSTGTPIFFSNKYLRAISISTGLSASEQLADYQIMQTFQSSLGRSV